MMKVHNSSHKKLKFNNILEFPCLSNKYLVFFGFKFTIYWEYETKFGIQIRQRRKMLGINQQTLADLAQISINTITKIENGEININFQKLYAILEVLGLELSLKIKNKEGYL